mmetsp:Transcript_8916/g.28168  ORF Transcript_8916/g.28168 Transcript_8916/m.28168 type:complete len:464 (-) Transcript_8916:406-1797(-)
MPKAIRTRVYQRHAEHRGVRHRRAVCRETLSLLLREPNGTTTPGVSSTNARTRQQRPDPPRTDSAREAPAHAPAASEGGGRAGGGPLVRLARGPALVCVALPLPVVGHAPVDGHARASPVARPRGGHLLGSLPADRHREEGPVAARPLRPLKQVVAREGGDGEQPLVEVGLQQRRVEPVGAEGPAERGGERVLDVARNLVEAKQEGDRAEGDDHREGEGGDLVHHNHREEAEVDEADEGVELRVREGEGRVHHLEGGVVRQRAVREDLVDARDDRRVVSEAARLAPLDEEGVEPAEDDVDPLSRPLEGVALAGLEAAEHVDRVATREVRLVVREPVEPRRRRVALVPLLARPAGRRAGAERVEASVAAEGVDRRRVEQRAQVEQAAGEGRRLLLSQLRLVVRLLVHVRRHEDGVAPLARHALHRGASLPVAAEALVEPHHEPEARGEQDRRVRVRVHEDEVVV